jgi:hypothetical protein
VHKKSNKASLSLNLTELAALNLNTSSRVEVEKLKKGKERKGNKETTKI